MSQAIKHITGDILFFSQEDSALVHYALCMQHSPTAAALEFLSPEPCPQQPLSLITRFRESYSSVSTSPESKRLKKSRSDELNSVDALIQHLSEKCDFRVFPSCQVVQKHKLLGVA